MNGGPKLELWAIGALLFAAVPCLAQGEVNKDALLDACARLEKQIFVGERFGVEQGFCDGKQNAHLSVMNKVGEKGFVHNTTDHQKDDDKSVMGMNQDCGFRLRGNKKEEWRVELAREKQELPPEFERSHKLAQSRVPVLFHRRLTEYVQSPTFEMREVGTVIRDGVNLVLVEFSCKHDDNEGRYIPEAKNGRMELMKDVYLLPVRVSFEAKYPADSAFSKVSKSFEYDLTDPKQPLVTKTIQETDYINVPDKEQLCVVVEYRYRNVGVEPEYSEFTLEPFGIDELKHFNNLIK